MFQATMRRSSGETTVFLWHLVLVILCGWLSGMQEHMLQHTRQKQLCLCDTWYLLFCVDDCLVCRSICSSIPDRNSCVCVTLGTCYSVWMTVWYAGAYVPAYQTETAVFVWHLVLVILCGSLSGMQEHMPQHTRQTQLCLCDTWYLLFCVDDCLVCRNICSSIPDSHPYRITK